MLSVERCRKLVRDLRESPDERHDRAILREFEEELNALDLTQTPAGGGRLLPASRALHIEGQLSFDKS